MVRGPAGIDAVHVADDAFGGEPREESHIIGHSVAPGGGEELELAVPFGRQAPAQHGLAGLQQMIVWTPPIGLGGRTTLSGAAVFGADDLFLLVPPPADGMALVLRVERIDDHDALGDGQTGRCRAGAEFAHHLGLGLTRESGFGDPGREFGQFHMVHGPAYRPPRRR